MRSRSWRRSTFSQLGAACEEAIVVLGGLPLRGRELGASVSLASDVLPTGDRPRRVGSAVAVTCGSSPLRVNRFRAGARATGAGIDRQAIELAS